VGSLPESITLGDLNGDGVLDIVTADNGSGTASVLLGKGDGTFNAKTSFGVGSNPQSVTLGDLNGDGVLDIVTADRGNNTASVLLGKGDGTFNAKTSFGVGSLPLSVTVGDLDRDGVLDIVTANEGDNTASVLLAQTKDGVSPLLPFDLATMAGARQAMSIFDDKLNQLAAQRGQIGAFQSRLDVAVNTLSVSRENYLAAKSQITDADVAQESAQLLKNQILQQAGAAVLAQANQAPALALMLLRGS
jgi:flagellin-like hook-associated protein FlgL